MSPEPATTVELRFAVDAEAPLVYVDTPYPDPPEDLAVEVAGPGVLATLVVPISQARDWAGELCHAVAVAYREATGDPHALSDEELATLPPAGGYDPGPGLLVVAGEGALLPGSASTSPSTSTAPASPRHRSVPPSSSG